jgi:hypothetical protein
MITKKPSRVQRIPGQVDADQVDAVIHRGGTPAASLASPDRAVPVALRVPQGLLSSVDRLVRSRRIRVPRHSWILEAIQEKVDREVGRGSKAGK